ncbi:hypothetical protein Clacol_001480 [Clathrus columnatus]|uniref:Up-regulated during septation protein 1 domain-containing protein n=1 Tax=Clathrus columnatus TaxID=1419009 RepID=A0AAV5A2Q6_9AGAM|nr:hypothetical protein Clacol_001480 [Clathrus columnatus]
MNGVRRFFATNLISPLSPSTPELPSPPSDPSIHFSKPVDNNSAKNLPLNHNAHDFPTKSDNYTLPLNIQTRNHIRKEDTDSSGRDFPQEDKAVVTGDSGSFKTIPKASRADTQDLFNKTHPDLQPVSSSHVVDKFKSTLTSDDPALGRVNSGSNVREDLLFSLLTSEAIVDTHDYKILTAEEVEELKQEQQSLASRIGTIKQKVALELKIRNASHNLQRLRSLKNTTDSTNNKPSVNDKVDAVNADLVRTLEESFRVDRKLLQHQAGVLSQSVRSLERKLSPESPKHMSHPSLTDTSISVANIHSRTSSSTTSVSTRAKFEGAHLFAGHARSILLTSSPKPNSSSDKSRIATLERNLEATNEAKTSAETKLASLEDEFQELLQQKAKLEKSYEIQLQDARNMIQDLEGQIVKLTDASNVQQQWEHDKLEWDNERQQWKSQLSQWHLDRKTWTQTEQQWDTQRQELEHSIQIQKDMIADLERSTDELLAVRMAKEELDRLVLQKDDECRRVHEVMEQDRAMWAVERTRLEAEVQRAQSSVRDSHFTETESLELREILEELIDLYEIAHDPQDKAILNIVSSIRNYLTLLATKNKDLVQEKSVLEDQIRVYEAGSGKNGETERQFRQGSDESGSETLPSTPMSKELFDSKELPETTTTPSGLPIDTGFQEYQKIIRSLKPLWAMLPSVESRAANLPKGGLISPVSPVMASSLSDLDVRTLKSLYDSKQGFVSPTIEGKFNVDEFVRRVHALINDDRALIERLLRFAQSHDLLRNNAERAQKLAQESNKGLEMYQAQVKTLEDRNVLLTRKQLTMLDEINSLQQSLNIIGKEKHDLEIETMDQNSTIQRLTEANNILSSRSFSLAEETGSLGIKAKLEAQVTEMRTKLQEAQNEVELLRSIESSQRVTLLDELNSLQQENNQLREQLRSRK